MKKSYLTVVLTLTCLFGLGISARAQDASRVVATVPFDFVAGGETFPAGTLVVNIVGCFLAGLLFYLVQERNLVKPLTGTVLMIGFLGGFTTFSSFGLQTFTLLRDGEFWFASLNIIGSNLLGLLMVWAGYTLGRLV